MPLAPPARSGYATQHGLLDGRKVGVALVTCFSMSQIHQLLEPPLELGAVVVHVGRHPQGLEHLLRAAAVVVARRSFSGSAATFLVSASMATSMKG